MSEPIDAEFYLEPVSEEDAALLSERENQPLLVWYCLCCRNIKPRDEGDSKESCWRCGSSMAPQIVFWVVRRHPELTFEGRMLHHG